PLALSEVTRTARSHHVAPTRRHGIHCGRCLTEGGIWDHWRASDGLHGIDRLIERTPDVLRLIRRIWEIDDRSCIRSGSRSRSRRRAEDELDDSARRALEYSHTGVELAAIEDMARWLATEAVDRMRRTTTTKSTILASSELVRLDAMMSEWRQGVRRDQR